MIEIQTPNFLFISQTVSNKIIYKIPHTKCKTYEIIDQYLYHNVILFIANLMTYMASYIRWETGETIEYATMLWISSCNRLLGGLFAGPLGGLLTKYIGFRWTCLAGGLVYR